MVAEKDCRKGIPIVSPKDPCPQLPGTILRIFIPAGAVINLLNLIEIASPSGICLIIRLPFLGDDNTDGKCKNNRGLLQNFISAVEQAGGSVQVMKD